MGKYIGQQDAYLSVIKAFRHSAIHLGTEVDVAVTWIEASDLEPPKADEESAAAHAKVGIVAEVVNCVGGHSTRGIGPVGWFDNVCFL